MTPGEEGDGKTTLRGDQGRQPVWDSGHLVVSKDTRGTPWAGERRDWKHWVDAQTFSASSLAFGQTWTCLFKWVPSPLTSLSHVRAAKGTIFLSVLLNSCENVFFIPASASFDVISLSSFSFVLTRYFLFPWPRLLLVIKKSALTFVFHFFFPWVLCDLISKDYYI